MTHTWFGRSNVHPIGQLTHTRSSDGAPEPDGVVYYSLYILGHREDSTLDNELPLEFIDSEKIF